MVHSTGHVIHRVRLIVIKLGFWTLVEVYVGTNLIHDFTAVTFSVKLAVFREKRLFP